MTSSTSQPTATAASSLPRTLTRIEALGFSLTGLILWITVAPGTHAELGMQAMWVWIPGALAGAIINLQVRQLGQQLPNVAGGTPNYITHLLPKIPWLTRYTAIGYCLSWVAVIPVNAIILTDFIQTNLSMIGIVLPEMGLKVGLVLMAFVVAFSGNRALSTLNLFFLLPAIGLLLLFCFQGSIWLSITDHPQPWVAIASTSTDFSMQDWAKWYLNGTYAFYACETAAVFAADSKQPQKTLKSLGIVATLIPVVYVVGSWLLLHLPSNKIDPPDTFLTLLTAAQPFWGSTTPLLITFLIVSGCLLSFTTAVSITPRVLYQLAKDQQLSPLFADVSEQGVFSLSLGLMLLLSLGCLVWVDLHKIVMITGVGWLLSFVVLHGGLWFHRRQIGGILPWLALPMAGLELFVLCIGGWTWGIHNLAIGILMPLFVILIDRLFNALSAPLDTFFNGSNPFSRLNFFQTARPTKFETLIRAQITLMVGFTSIVAIISWQISEIIAQADTAPTVNFLVVLILVMSFFGVAIACWTVFPQISAINNARQTAEALSEDLDAALQQVKQTQLQMVQQEKLSGLGQLVAGIAHEINNPVSFIHGNLDYAEDYITELMSLVELYQSTYPQGTNEIRTAIEDIDLDFLTDDLTKILKSMRIGTDRIREIVLSLRNFSRKDEATCKSVDIHEGLESTLLILQHRLKATDQRPDVQVLKHYAKLPLVECYPSQLNQVFMNVLANAIDAMEDTNQNRSYAEIEETPNKITIQTQTIDDQWIEITIADNGPGIPEAIRDRIFDPFFTTKPVGSGTGLGMSISYQIVTQHHQGKFSCTPAPKQGTEFIIQIPMAQNATNPSQESQSQESQSQESQSQENDNHNTQKQLLVKT
ncbi:MAG: ATP-binding protein [Cyanobacteria bacterium P01_D01_bin.105]